MTKIYKTKEEIKVKAGDAIDKSLRNLVSKNEIDIIEKEIAKQRSNRKGLLGYLVEKYFFDIEPGSDTGPDFKEAEVELKTNPLKKHPKKRYISKERLVFSMINYNDIVHESWANSSFLRKNKNLLIMFYLWLRDKNILDYKFKFVHFLDLLEDISDEDVYQIRKDWEFIVDKIRRGEAHLLSEGDTYYLGACTKAANSSVVRDQPMRRIKAKPRAFSFKQPYLNYLIQKEFLGNKLAKTDSIFKKKRRVETIQEVVHSNFAPFLGKVSIEIEKTLGVTLNRKAKSYKRILVNKILGVEANRIEELEKANVTLRVVTLEHTGTLKESISFPTFDYKDLITQIWYDEKQNLMSDFHAQLESRKFLFVVFQKQKDSDDIVLKKIIFWNFPMKDLPEAEMVWEKAVKCIREGRYEELPKISESRVAHVRPHGRNAQDTLETPQGTHEVKRSFWLNAKYIQKAIENDDKFDQ